MPWISFTGPDFLWWERSSSWVLSRADSVPRGCLDLLNSGDPPLICIWWDNGVILTMLFLSFGLRLTALTFPLFSCRYFCLWAHSHRKWWPWSRRSPHRYVLNVRRKLLDCFDCSRSSKTSLWPNAASFWVLFLHRWMFLGGFNGIFKEFGTKLNLIHFLGSKWLICIKPCCEYIVCYLHGLCWEGHCYLPGFPVVP